MLAWLLYVLFGRVMALVLVRFRSSDFKELEIVVLRHELAVLSAKGSRLNNCWNRAAQRPKTLGISGFHHVIC